MRAIHRWARKRLHHVSGVDNEEIITLYIIYKLLGPIEPSQAGGWQEEHVYVMLPFTVTGLTRDLRVAIMLQLEEDCYLVVNFGRAFKAVRNPDIDRLYCKDAKAYVGWKSPISTPRECLLLRSF